MTDICFFCSRPTRRYAIHDHSSHDLSGRGQKGQEGQEGRQDKWCPFRPGLGLIAWPAGTLGGGRCYIASLGGVHCPKSLSVASQVNSRCHYVPLAHLTRPRIPSLLSNFTLFRPRPTIPSEQYTS